MNSSTLPLKIEVSPPSRVSRIMSVWQRHYQVYTRNILSNGIPPFLEPLFFLVGIGLGLGKYIGLIEGTPFLQFLASGIVIPSAMFTASFECTFGTFIRLEFDNIYEGMLSASITVDDLLVGEMFFSATKGMFYSAAVLLVVALFGLIPSPMALFAPVAGFFTGLMFAALSLYITSYVTTINHFNFYFTGLLTPMFFFSGIIFPLSNLPGYLQVVAWFFPLTHSVNIVRAFCFAQFDAALFYDVLYVFVFTAIFGFMAIRRLKKRLVS